MSGDDLTFMMGEFEATFPTNRLYANNHMWAYPLDEGYRFGFTAYAVRLLQDVYFLDWNFDPGVDINEKQEIGSIESKKAESALYSPMGGHLHTFNDQVMSDPSAINVDKYGDGWIFEIQGQHDFMSPDEYIQHLEQVWPLAQRTIKGQLNE